MGKVCPGIASSEADKCQWKGSPTEPSLGRDWRVVQAGPSMWGRGSWCSGELTPSVNSSRVTVCWCRWTRLVSDGPYGTEHGSGAMRSLRRKSMKGLIWKQLSVRFKPSGKFLYIIVFFPLDHMSMSSAPCGQLADVPTQRDFTTKQPFSLTMSPASL